MAGHGCQSALLLRIVVNPALGAIAPGKVIALAPPELVGVVEAGRARLACVG